MNVADFLNITLHDAKFVLKPCRYASKHKALTGMDNKAVLGFAKYLEKKNIPVWIRCVIVKGLTDNENDLLTLGKFIGSLKNLKALDVLPYHTMGIQKYKELNINYPLDGVEALSPTDAKRAKDIILNGIRIQKTEF